MVGIALRRECASALLRSGGRCDWVVVNASVGVRVAAWCDEDDDEEVVERRKRVIVGSFIFELRCERWIGY